MRNPEQALEIHPDNTEPQGDHTGTMPQYYLCGICEHLHPIDWNGDCREDANRFTYDALDARHPTGWLEFAMPGTEDDNPFDPESPEGRAWEAGDRSSVE